MTKRSLAALALVAGLAVASPAVGDDATPTTDGIAAQFPDGRYATTPVEDIMDAITGPLGMGIGVIAVSMAALVLRDRRRAKQDAARVRQAIVHRGTWVHNPFPTLQSPYAATNTVSLQLHDMVRAWSESTAANASTPFERAATPSAPMPLPPPVVVIDEARPAV